MTTRIGGLSMNLVARHEFLRTFWAMEVFRARMKIFGVVDKISLEFLYHIGHTSIAGLEERRFK